MKQSFDMKTEVGSDGSVEAKKGCFTNFRWQSQATAPREQGERRVETVLTSTASKLQKSLTMPHDRKDSSAADTTKNTLAELLPGPDPTPPPKTPTPTNNNKNGNNGTNNANNTNNNNGGGGGNHNCRMMVANPFDDIQPRPSPVMMQSMARMRPGMVPGPHMAGHPGHHGPPAGMHPHGPPHGPQCGGMHPGMMHGGPGGKMYPPNQPMIFNASNPNAPPIYPCGVCHKEVHENDQAILCESGCNFWFHRMCVGLTDDAFHMLKSEVYAEWVCDRCFATKNIAFIKFKP
ncbi:hypothetical protein ACOMHN_012307 [Nucella lapillus]